MSETLTHRQSETIMSANETSQKGIKELEQLITEAKQHPPCHFESQDAIVDVLPKGRKRNRLIKIHAAVFSKSCCNTCKGNCCEYCASQTGYLEPWDLRTDLLQGHHIPAEIKDKSAAIVAKYKELFGFDAVTGFRTDKGCAIPEGLRSVTCLSYYCFGSDGVYGVTQDWRKLPGHPSMAAVHAYVNLLEKTSVNQIPSEDLQVSLNQYLAGRN